MTMNKEEELIRKKSPVNIRNKKAAYEYFFIDTYTAGIVLTGTEIKSIRMGKASLVDTFCYINNGEIWVKGMSVSPYFYDCSRPRSRQDIPSCRCSCLSMATDAQRWTSPCARARKTSTSDRH